MSSIPKIREVMVPVEEYVTVDESATLHDIFLTLEDDRKNKENLSHAYRDVLVFDAKGVFLGKVTMVDIFQSLEPNYQKFGTQETDHSTLTNSYVAKIFKEFDLWTESLDSLCEKSVDVKVKDLMHVPVEGEYVEADEELEKAIHRYIMGVHQPLLVRENGKLIGVLRFGDIFEIIKQCALDCKA